MPAIYLSEDEIRVCDAALNISSDADDAADEVGVLYPDMPNPASVLQGLRGKVRVALCAVDKAKADRRG